MWKILLELGGVKITKSCRNMTDKNPKHTTIKFLLTFYPIFM